MNRDEFKRFCGGISALYNKSYSNTDELNMLFELYEDYSLKEMQDALKKHMKESNFLPKPASLLKFADEARELKRQEEFARQRSLIRYDSNGRQIYSCPFCHDSGFMIVDDDPIYSPAATRCICQHPIKKLEYERNGRVRLKLKSKHRYSDGYYVFDFSKFMFVSENKKQQQVSGEKKDPDEILKAATAEMSFPF